MKCQYVVDGHVHVWDLSRRPQPWIDPATMAVLGQDHLVADLAACLDSEGVSGAVLVQVLNDAEETDDYLWAAVAPQLLGVVAWTDLTEPSVGDDLDRLVAHPSGSHLAGIRHQALAERDPVGWLQRVGGTKAFAALSDRRLPFDLMLGPAHLAAAYDVVRAHPATTFVLDHAGKPPVVAGWRSDTSRGWAADLVRLGALPNVVVKLSGLTTVADIARWEVGDLAPYVDHLLEHVGPDRLAFGSDWPVSLRGGSYARTLAAVRELVGGLSPDEQRAVLAGTACRVYRLRDPLP